MNAQTLDQKLPSPDKAPLNRIQATRLSGLTGINQDELAGRTIAEISARYPWQIDPDYLRFRQICGKVVKQDPVTGVFEPVPGATVKVEDTVCTFLGLFPVNIPWSWLFPIRCTTEVLATVTTDACGNFCFLLPFFEIEWILRFRLERTCYPEFFVKPTVGSVLQSLQGRAASSTAPVTLKPNTSLYQKAEQLLGTAVVRQLAATSSSKAFGQRNTQQQALLARPAFPVPLAPPLPRKLRKTSNQVDRKAHRQAVRSTLANDLGLHASELENFDLKNYRGPFLRCYDVLVPEWVPFYDVPDVAFTVTQTINGSETTIYSGGYFDIGWSTGVIPSVTLVASAIAVSSPSCSAPPVDCSNTPSIQTAGQMPVINSDIPGAEPYIDSNGYATRPNPPRADGSLPPGYPLGAVTGTAEVPSTAPYCGELALFGCNQAEGAAFYRVLYTQTPAGSTTPLPQTPFMGTWSAAYDAPGIGTVNVPVAPDANGWYPVLPSLPTGDPGVPWYPTLGNTLLQEWNTAALGEGLFEVVLEVSSFAGSETPPTLSDVVPFVVDNSSPTITYSAEYSYSPDLSGAQPVPTDDCIIINRTAGQTVYIQITYTVTATHLRSVQLNPGGCGGGATLYASGSPVQHWYTGEDDNSYPSPVTPVVYQIAPTQADGVYTFEVYADTRAFNPAGSDDGVVDDWNYNPLYIWTNPSFAVGIVTI